LFIFTPALKATNYIHTSHTSEKLRYFDKYAVSLKTGKEIALIRTPVQLLTFLRPVNNILIIGEAPDISVGKYKMIDVVSHLYDYEKNNDSVSIFKRDTNLDTSVIVNEESAGWKSDAHKNFPGFISLWNAYPNASWYIMLDDDSYVFMDNLDIYLKNFDPSKPYYIGSPTSFV
jgi:hypothetical protein